MQVINLRFDVFYISQRPVIFVKPSPFFRCLFEPRLRHKDIALTIRCPPPFPPHHRITISRSVTSIQIRIYPNIPDTTTRSGLEYWRQAPRLDDSFLRRPTALLCALVLYKYKHIMLHLNAVIEFTKRFFKFHIV